MWFIFVTLAIAFFIAVYFLFDPNQTPHEKAKSGITEQKTDNNAPVNNEKNNAAASLTSVKSERKKNDPRLSLTTNTKQADKPAATTAQSEVTPHAAAEEEITSATKTEEISTPNNAINNEDNNQALGGIITSLTRKINSRFLSFAFSPPPLTEKCKNILKEFLETETSYVTSLYVLKEVFVTPLKNSKLVDKETFTAIFSNIELITTINDQFLFDLELAFAQHRMSLTPADGQQISLTLGKRSTNLQPLFKPKDTNLDIAGFLAAMFLHHSHAFKLYTEYINNYDHAISVLRDQRKKSKDFEVFLKQKHQVLAEHKQRSFDIQSFLIMPVQRLPRYKMLLEDLQRNLKAGYKSHTLVTEAVEQMRTIATFCNEKKREIEKLLRLSEIQQALGMKNLISPARRFVKEGDVRLIRKNGMPTTAKCRLYLFNDLLLASKKKTFGIKKYLLALDGCSTSLFDDPHTPTIQVKRVSMVGGRMEIFSEKQTPPRVTITDIDPKVAQFGFTVQSPAEGGSGPISISIVCSSESEKKGWVREIQTCINQLAGFSPQ